MKKVLDLLKNLRLIEKITIMAGSILIIVIGLIFNIYSDTKLHITVGYLFAGLLLGLVGGTLQLVGLNINLFDVKIKGLILLGSGILLSVGSVVIYPIYISSAEFVALDSALKGPANIICILLIAFSIVSCVISSGGFVIQLIRKIKNIEE